MEEIQVPIYLMTGFLDSGKTSFLRFTLEQEYFAIPETTLLLLCEEGEEQYDPKTLEKYRVIPVVIEDQTQFTSAYLNALDIAYRPGRVIIEYNGMWQVSQFEAMQLPKGWGVAQQITTVDASTFQMYMTNMKSLFMEMVRNTELVVFNRSSMDMPLATFRRGIKVANQKAEVIFEDEEGELDIFGEEMPFDIEAPVIEIMPEDYGIWYVDAMDHPENYVNKTVKFKGRVMKPTGMGSKYFVPGRTAMTCCADDTTFIGFVCHSAYAPKLANGQWVEVTAQISIERLAVYHGEGPVLHAIDVQVCDALPDEMVYFN